MSALKLHNSSPCAEQINDLFLDNLHLVADGPLSDQFFAMKTEGSGDEMWWLLPFRPELMSYLDLESLRRRDSGLIKCVRAGGTGDNYMEVSLTLGGETFRRRYPWNSLNRDMAGNALDLRIWPNYRFLITPKLPVVDEDRVHYIRIRQQEVWNLCPQILARPTNPGASGAVLVRAFQTKIWDPGWPEAIDPQNFRSSRCYAFPAKDRTLAFTNAPATVTTNNEWEPVGLAFEGRGFCLFKLAAPAESAYGVQGTPLRVGVNVGVENTCVATVADIPRVKMDAMEVRFEMQTMSLHANPKYERVDDLLAMGQFTEGPAAVLDFPYKYADETHITEAPFFPTQWVTRLPESAEPINTHFLMSNGMIFHRNLLDFKDIVQLLNDYFPAPQPDRRPFRVIFGIHYSNHTWPNQTFRRPFLWHLYKLLVHHAGRNGARISSAVFSFPTSFSKDQVNRYRNELHNIFHDHGQVPLTAITLMTESDAVLNLLDESESAENILVLDFGGATTDLLGLIHKGRFQASYKFAAESVNQYFTASPPLQRMFEEALWKVIKEEEIGTRLGDQQADRKKHLKDLFGGQNGQNQVRADYMEQGFFHMLGMLEDKHYPLLVDELQKLAERGKNETNRKALGGFFHTLVLLYAGMVYQAGRLMRQQNTGADNIKVRLIGNGSRFYRFLSHRSSDFETVLQGIFQAGYEQKAHVQIIIDPGIHTLVAKGLLARVHQNRTEVMVDLESHDYLLKLSEQPTTLPTPEQFDKLMGPDLVPFLEALNRELPSGQLDASTVIPYCEPNLLNEMRRLFVSIPTAVFSREIDNAKSLKEDWFKAEELAKTSETAAIPHRESALATEPVFVIRLKCLIEKIRDNYANIQYGHPAYGNPMEAAETTETSEYQPSVRQKIGLCFVDFCSRERGDYVAEEFEPELRKQVADVKVQLGYWRSSAQEPYFSSERPQVSCYKAWVVTVGSDFFLLPWAMSANSFDTVISCFEVVSAAMPKNLKDCLPATLKVDGKGWSIEEQGRLSSQLDEKLQEWWKADQKARQPKPVRL